MVPSIEPEPDLLKLAIVPGLLCMQPAGEGVNHGVPIVVPLKESMTHKVMEGVATESRLPPFLVLLPPHGTTVVKPVHHGTGLISISLPWNQDENPLTSFSEKFLVEIGLFWPVQIGSPIDLSTRGLVIIPLPATNERSDYFF
jgi:hypothetical protein